MGNYSYSEHDMNDEHRDKEKDSELKDPIRHGPVLLKFSLTLLGKNRL